MIEKSPKTFDTVIVVVSLNNQLLQLQWRQKLYIHFLKLLQQKLSKIQWQEAHKSSASGVFFNFCASCTLSRQ